MTSDRFAAMDEMSMPQVVIERMPSRRNLLEKANKVYQENLNRSRANEMKRQDSQQRLTERSARQSLEIDRNVKRSFSQRNLSTEWQAARDSARAEHSSRGTSSRRYAREFALAKGYSTAPSTERQDSRRHLCDMQSTRDAVDWSATRTLENDLAMIQTLSKSSNHSERRAPRTHGMDRSPSRRTLEREFSQSSFVSSSSASRNFTLEREHSRSSLNSYLPSPESSGRAGRTVPLNEQPRSSYGASPSWDYHDGHGSSHHRRLPEPSRSCSSAHSRSRASRNNRPLIEVAPELFMYLTGTDETIEAISRGNIVISSCTCCSCDLTCVMNAEFVLCPDCRVVSPVNQCDSTAMKPRHGGNVALGVKSNTLQKIMDDM